MKFSENHYYDQDGSYITSKYFVNGEEYSENDYSELLDEFDIVDYDVVDDDDDDCCDCVDCVDCTINMYAEMIYELANGQICPGCVHDVLESFFDTMVDHIIIESLEGN